MPYTYFRKKIFRKYVLIFTFEPNIVKHQSDYQILILGIVW